MSVRRRTFLKGMLGAGALVAAPALARAQRSPMRIGFLNRKDRPAGRKLVNSVITYPNVGQFWTYDPDEFLKHPVYNRESWPGGRNVEP